jgi:uncharacterized membrane protein YhiD involved in acid resistance
MNKEISFNDLIKEGLLNIDLSASISMGGILTSLIITLAVSSFIFYIYKKTYHGVLYTKAFNRSLVLISLVTTLVIMTISSNIILSLGMVGALSIVRFRTAVKDSMDIVFMFWSISVGIANGAGLFQVSIIGTLFIGAVLLVMSRSKGGLGASPYMLIINYAKETDDQVMNQLATINKYNIKSKNISGVAIEMTVETFIKNNEVNCVNDFINIEGVADAVLVKYDGDYVS